MPLSREWGNEVLMRVSEVFAMGSGTAGGGSSTSGYDYRRDSCTDGYRPYTNGFDYNRDYGRYPYYHSGYGYGGYTYCGHYRFLGIL